MNTPISIRQTMPRERRSKGFTLIELVVVVILLGVLAAMAVPRFIDLSHAARIAAVKGLQGAVLAASDNLHAACLLAPSCDATSNGQYNYFDSKAALMVYGWLNGGNGVGAGVDIWVEHEGFTPVAIDIYRTSFRLDGAPDPGNCAVVYEDVEVRGVGNGVGVTILTTGC